MKEELKAALDALWNDSGVEGALAAIERVFKGNPTVRVGQWMSESEYENFIETGNIPITNVLRNAQLGLAEIKGIILPDPIGTNIKHVFTKLE